jgi:hypothetical protein
MVGRVLHLCWLWVYHGKGGKRAFSAGARFTDEITFSGHWFEQQLSFFANPKTQIAIV